jgi:2,3-bisphosphoglycerate-independent phosphoglycerate mutase
MAKAPVSPVVLVILDGWGYREQTAGNAVAAADLPVMNSLWAAYPHTLINASGKDVGLPVGQMGNSEVGHLSIGAGRVVPQELVRISDAVEEGTLLSNTPLVKLFQEVKRRGTKLHLIGLCSDGGVHSHINHLLGLVDMAQDQQLEQVCIHAITDGRDTTPSSAKGYLQILENHLQQVGIGQVVTISGRYYAMDRDRRWDRVQQAYETMVSPDAGTGQSATALLEAVYAEGITDEFVPPTRLAQGEIAPGDGVVFFNFRPDRARQIVQAFVDPQFTGFERPLISPLGFATFTQYDSSLPVAVAFEPESLTNLLGEVVASHGLKQLRTAETEKYAHVTYFFNGGREQPFEGEDRELIPSPDVATYDKSPAMSAAKVTDVALAAVAKRQYSLVVINYANPDMVGHTGMMEPTVQALEAVDHQLGRLLSGVCQAGGTTLIIADHGNAEVMVDEDGNPWTAHTTNLVPFILVEGEGLKIPGHGTEVQLRSDGRLADVAPTILELLRLPQPSEMTGRSMILPTGVELKQNRTPVKLGR